ncbi:hypothetical protein POM88_034693 [Heracleum sosnowskyi]|uniref:PRMT5 oligomerisation domain-containing protein n=1 Tax=Heracleum sosnowskyi TaxID=360622 RepID=A0AAD8HJZ2_9APIA|nr:hypothetical protein POM88_034693 [Heracleum sosnowskyi]
MKFMGIPSKLYADIKSQKDLVHFETIFVVKLHRVARLALSKPVFTFVHPEYSTDNSNQRYKKLQFGLPSDTGSAIVHGSRTTALHLSVHQFTYLQVLYNVVLRGKES